MATWKNPERKAYLAKLYKAIGRDDVYRSELGAMANIVDLSVFHHDVYVGFLSAPPLVTSDPIDAVYLGIDPAYRGKCQLAIIAIGQVSGGKIGFHVCIISLFILHAIC